VTSESTIPADSERVIAELTTEVEVLRARLEQTGAAARIGDALAAAVIAEEIVAPTTHQQLLEMIVETAASVISAKAGALFLIDEEAGDLVFQVALGGSADEVKNIRVPLGHGIAGGVALSGLPIAVSNASSDRRWAKDIGEKVDYPRQNVAPLLYREWEQCEKPFFEPGATQLAAHQTGKASQYAWLVGDDVGLAAQKEQLDALMTRAKREVLDGDECLVWEHPLEGTFKRGLGGAAATGTRHMFSWGIASAMLHFYRNQKTAEYLPYLDGMVKWTRHYLYDRAGMADLPWAVFSMGAANGGEFLLD